MEWHISGRVLTIVRKCDHRLAHGIWRFLRAWEIWRETVLLCIQYCIACAWKTSFTVKNDAIPIKSEWAENSANCNIVYTYIFHTSITGQKKSYNNNKKIVDDAKDTSWRNQNKYLNHVIVIRSLDQSVGNILINVACFIFLVACEFYFLLCRDRARKPKGFLSSCFLRFPLDLSLILSTFIFFFYLSPFVLTRPLSLSLYSISPVHNNNNNDIEEYPESEFIYENAHLNSVRKNRKQLNGHSN